ncbi:MAG: TIGR01244 family sulfur transferase [Pseudomonadota bacterium]
MPMIPLTHGFRVAPQISTADIEAAHEAGISLVICNRVEGEAPGQPENADMAAAVEAKGMSFAAIPMAGGVSPAQLDELDRLMAEHQNIVAYCASGKRSALLWAATRARAGDSIDSILHATAAAGFDFSGFRDSLASLSPAG